MRPRWNDQTIVHDVLRGKGRFLSDNAPGSETFDDRKLLYDSFIKSQIIRADNVFDYVHDNESKLNYSDVPNSVPPFDDCVVHFNVPTKGASPNEIESVAVLLRTEHWDDKEGCPKYGKMYSPLREHFHDGDKYLVHHHIWIRSAIRNVIHFDGMGLYRLDDKGSIVFGGDNYKKILPSLSKPVLDSLQVFSMVAIYACCFMNVQNVEKIDCTDEFTPMYGKKFKGEKLPELKWNRILITDAKKTKKKNPLAPVDDDNRGRAFHIRKGKFVTWHAENGGYFGRGRTVTHWVPSCEVGDKAFGTVIKDYEVGPVGATPLPETEDEG